MNGLRSVLALMQKRSMRIYRILFVVFVVLLLVLVGCASSTRIRSQRVELVRSFDLKLDSVEHQWVVNRVTLYDAGKIAKVVEEERHNKSEKSSSLRDTVYINSNDTTYVYRDAAPVVQQVRDIKWTMAIVAGVIIFNIIVWLLIKLRVIKI